MELFDIVFLGMLLVLMIVVAAFAFDRWGPGQTRARRQAIKDDLDRIDSQLAKIREGAENFLPDDPPPYNSLSRKLHTEIEKCQVQARTLRSRVQISAQPPSTQAESVPAYVWLATIPGLRHYFRNRRRLHEVVSEKKALSKAVSDAQDSLKQLEELPRTVAARYRALAEDISRGKDIFRQLQTARVVGPALFDAMKRLQEYQDTLAEFPQDIIDCYPRNRASKLPAKASVITAWSKFEPVSGEITDTVSLLNGWRQTQQALFALIRKNAGLLDQLNTSMQKGAMQARYPIKWVGGDVSLHQLRKQQKAIGITDSRRPPETLEKELAAAQALNTEAEELSKWIAKVTQNRQALLSTIDHPQFADVGELDRRAKSLAEATAIYQPTEWDNQDRIGNITKDSAALFKECNDFLSHFASNAMVDRALTQSLITTGKNLVERLTGFQARLDRIDARFKAIDQATQRNREMIEDTLTALNAILAEVTRLSKKRDIGKALREAERPISQLQNEGRKFQSRMSGSNSMKVDQLTKDVEKWAKRCRGRLLELSQNLHREITARQDRLNDLVKSTRNLASLDREPAMRQAEQQRKLLAGYKPLRRQSPTSVTAEELRGQIVAQMNYRINLQAALSTFEDEIGSSLFLLFEQEDAKAVQAETALVPLQKMKNNVDYSLRNEIQKAEKLLRQADKDIADLERIGHTMAEVRMHLHRSTQKYDQVIDQVRKISSRLEMQVSQ